MTIANLTVGSKIFLTHNIPDGPYDSALWRADDAGIPPMYRATVEHKATLNQPGTNVNEVITVKVPEVVLLAGKWTLVNTHVASARVASLQNTVDTVSSALALDTLINVLTTRRAAILAGNTNS